MVFTSYYTDFLFLAAEITFSGMVLLSLIVFTVAERKRILGTHRTKGVTQEMSISYSVSVYFIMLLTFYLYFAVTSNNISWYLFDYALSNVYGMSFFKTILAVLFILIFYAGISDISFNRIKYMPFEANYILGFVFIGMLFFLHSFDFIMLFLTLELQNFSLYILMNIQRNRKVVVETCVKYYIIGVYLQV